MVRADIGDITCALRQRHEQRERPSKGARR